MSGRQFPLLRFQSSDLSLIQPNRFASGGVSGQKIQASFAQVSQTSDERLILYDVFS